MKTAGAITRFVYNEETNKALRCPIDEVENAKEILRSNNCLVSTAIQFRKQLGDKKIIIGDIRNYFANEKSYGWRECSMNDLYNKRAFLSSLEVGRKLKYIISVYHNGTLRKTVQTVGRSEAEAKSNARFKTFGPNFVGGVIGYKVQIDEEIPESQQPHPQLELEEPKETPKEAPKEEIELKNPTLKSFVLQEAAKQNKSLLQLAEECLVEKYTQILISRYENKIRELRGA